MRPECLEAAAAYRLVLPGHPSSGRIGERLGRATGASLEFMDFRDYVPGDDLRHVDWRAYARTDQLKVRLYREETAPSMDIVLDTSASMTVTEVKRQAALDLVDAAAEWTLRQGGRPRRLAAGGEAIDEAVGVMFADDSGGGLVPSVPLRPRLLRFVVSDFLDHVSPAPSLRRLASGAAHLYVLQVLDPWELEPELAGETTLIDCEVASRLDITLDEGTVARYLGRLARLRTGVERAVRQVGSYALVRAAAPARMFRDDLMRQGLVEPA